MAGPSGHRNSTYGTTGQPPPQILRPQTELRRIFEFLLGTGVNAEKTCATKKSSVDNVDIHCMGEWTTKNYIYVYIILQPWYYITIAYMIIMIVYKAVCYPSIHPPSQWIILQYSALDCPSSIFSLALLSANSAERNDEKYLQYAAAVFFFAVKRHRRHMQWGMAFAAQFKTHPQQIGSQASCPLPPVWTPDLRSCPLAAWVSSNFALKMMQFDSTAG